MKSRSFIAYPDSRILLGEVNIELNNAPLGVKLQAFISSYYDNYKKFPDSKTICSIFGVSEKDAELALSAFRA